MPRILMIVRNLPPAQTVSAIRPAKFIRYLQEFGWEPHVITLRSNPIYGLDDSLLEDIKSARLYRIQPAGMMAYSLANLRRFYPSVARQIGYLGFPDHEFEWAIHSSIECARIYERVRPDLVWITAVPRSAAMAAYLIKSFARVPVVVDYHNEWIDTFLNAAYPSWWKSLQYLLEAKTIQFADATVVLNKNHYDDLKGKTGNPVELIENGYDSAVPTPDYAEANYDKFHVVYLGSIYDASNPAIVFEALDEAITEKSVQAEDVRLSYYSFFSWPDASKFKFKMEGYQPVPKAQVEKLYEDASIMLISYQSLQTPTRCYEYCVSGRPVIACVKPESRSAEIVQKSNAGFVADVSNKDEIRKTIVRVYGLWKERKLKLKLDTEFLGKFHRRRLAEKLSNFLYGVIAR